MTTIDQWAQELLAFGDWSVTLEKRIGFCAWALAEGVPSVPRCSGAEWNPLDTTEPADGTSDFNAVGVKNYPSQQVGIEAVYATLRNGRYNDMLAVLADEGSSAMSMAACDSLTVWGTGHFGSVVELVKQDPSRYLSVEVPGGGPPPGPSPAPSPQEVTVNVPQLRSEGAGPYRQPSQPVRIVQYATGATIDGKFGEGTEAAVRAFQEHHAIGVDGIVGPETWGKVVNG